MRAEGMGRKLGSSERISKFHCPDKIRLHSDSFFPSACGSVSVINLPRATNERRTIDVPIRRANLEVFLVHPGGPFWAGKDEGAWSIPKGLIDPGEDNLAAAKREFEEETSIPSSEPFIGLGEVRQKSGKRIFAWAFRKRRYAVREKQSLQPGMAASLWAQNGFSRDR